MQAFFWFKINRVRIDAIVLAVVRLCKVRIWRLNCEHSRNASKNDQSIFN